MATSTRPRDWFDLIAHNRRYDREALKRELAAEVESLSLEKVARLSPAEVSWRLTLLGEMVWEARRTGAWGGEERLPALRVARDLLAASSARRQGQRAWLRLAWPLRLGRAGQTT